MGPGTGGEPEPAGRRGLAFRVRCRWGGRAGSRPPRRWGRSPSCCFSGPVYLLNWGYASGTLSSERRRFPRHRSHFFAGYLAQLEGGETRSRLGSPPAVGSCGAGGEWGGGGGGSRGFCAPCGSSSDLCVPAEGPSPLCLPQTPSSRVAAEVVNPAGFLGAGVRECAVLVAGLLPPSSPGGFARPVPGSIASFSEK